MWGHYSETEGLPMRELTTEELEIVEGGMPIIVEF